MTEVVSDFSERKAAEWLDTGLYPRVLVEFRHGLGDSIGFMASCAVRLRQLYPSVSFTFSTHLGQEALFGDADTDRSHYDLVLVLAYPETPWSEREITKQEHCAEAELGISGIAECYQGLLRPVASRFVGVHFNSTAFPSINMPEDMGRRLWEQIEAEGLVPVDTHMRHKYDNSRSVIYPFEECRRIDGLPATTDRLLGVLAGCSGFAGVCSGNFHCALATMQPDRILFLQTAFPPCRVTRMPVRVLDVSGGNYDEGVVHAWLERLKS